MSLATSVVSGAVGGLFATIAANFLWRVYTRPNVNILSSTIPKYAYSQNGEIDGVVHKGIVSNRGRSAATNCRIDLFLFGVGDGCSYQIDCSTVWSKSEYPSHLMINRGELVNFELIKILEESGDQVVQFPSENGWDSPTTIQKWEKEFGYDLPEYKFPIEEGDNPKLLEDLSLGTISDVNWIDSRVTIYSRNAKKKSKHVQIDAENGELDISLPGSVSRYGISQHSRVFKYLHEYLKREFS